MVSIPPRLTDAIHAGCSNFLFGKEESPFLHTPDLTQAHPDLNLSGK